MFTKIKIYIHIYNLHIWKKRRRNNVVSFINVLEYSKMLFHFKDEICCQFQHCKQEFSVLAVKMNYDSFEVMFSFSFIFKSKTVLVFISFSGLIKIYHFIIATVNKHSLDATFIAFLVFSRLALSVYSSQIYLKWYFVFLPKLS